MIRISKSAWQLTLLGLGLYFLFLIYQLPATVAWQWMPASLTQQIELQGISGRIWSGQARNLILKQQSYGQLQWRILPWDLLGNISLYATVHHPDAKLAGDFTIADEQAFSATELDIELAAHVLQSLTQPVVPMGRIRATIDELQFERGKVLTIKGDATWQDAAIENIPTLPLGEIIISAVPENNGSKISISNTTSPLEIKGSIQLQANGRYNAAVSLLNRNPKQEELSSMLALLGKTDATGRVHIKQSGQLRFR